MKRLSSAVSPHNTRNSSPSAVMPHGLPGRCDFFANHPIQRIDRVKRSVSMDPIHRCSPSNVRACGRGAGEGARDFDHIFHAQFIRSRAFLAPLFEPARSKRFAR